MPFAFKRLALPEVVLVSPKVFPDDRGYFLEIFKSGDFAKEGLPEVFVQDNCSRSKRGVVRGLHFQKNPSAQGKLVQCLRGRIFDVAVDLRKGSPSYGKWVGEFLDEENHHMLYVPTGFAHGFCAVGDINDVSYKVTSPFAPQDDRGMRWNDPALGVDWHLPCDAIISGKDAALPLFKDIDCNFTL